MVVVDQFRREFLLKKWVPCTVKAEIRKKEKITAGDSVLVKIKLEI